MKERCTSGDADVNSVSTGLTSGRAKALNVLFLVDRAVGDSGPHRNVVSTLNALVTRSDVRVTLLTGRIDANEPYSQSSRLSVVSGFEPKTRAKIPAQMRSVLKLARPADVIYVPTGLTSALYAFAAKLVLGKRLVLGPT